jgi:hypothetical protein
MFMLFLIFVGILAVAIGLWVIEERTRHDVGLAAFSTTLAGVLLVAISLCILACSYIGLDGYVDAMHVRYEVLTYQYENDVYDNDNDIGKRELMKEIQDWNEDLACNKRNQNDFWIGIFIPDIYDQFDFIELDRTE